MFFDLKRTNPDKPKKIGKVCRSGSKLAGQGGLACDTGIHLVRCTDKSIIQVISLTVPGMTWPVFTVCFFTQYPRSHILGTMKMDR